MGLNFQTLCVNLSKKLLFETIESMFSLLFYYKKKIFSFFFSATLLQPSNSILLPESMGAQVGNDVQLKSTTLSDVGQTWSNAGPLNIDLDNLLSSKSNKSGPSLSMNQLKLQSPVKQSQIPMMSPPPLHINNNNFNNLNNNFCGNLTQQPNRHPGNVQQPSQPQLFGNLMMTSNPNANLNNQFDAFQ